MPLQDEKELLRSYRRNDDLLVKAKTQLWDLIEKLYDDIEEMYIKHGMSDLLNRMSNIKQQRKIIILNTYKRHIETVKSNILLDEVQIMNLLGLGQYLMGLIPLNILIVELMEESKQELINMCYPNELKILRKKVNAEKLMEFNQRHECKSDY